MKVTEALPIAADLDPAALMITRIVQGFFSDHERVLQRFIGRRVKPNPLRDMLMRLIVMEFANDTPKPLVHYQIALKDFGSRSSVQRALDFIISRDIAVIVTDPADLRSGLIFPTARLITFYNQVMPELRELTRSAMQAVDLAFPVIGPI